MSLIIADRVVEMTTTTGTGDITLAGAVTGYRAFSSVCATGDTVYYVIEAIDSNGIPTGAWEVGLGTYSAANTLTRSTVKASSNAGAAVSLAAGTKRVMISADADYLKSAGAASQPVIRSSNIGALTSNASTITVTLPTGTAAGDVVVLFASQNNTVNLPSGWSQLDNQAGSWIGALMAAKVMTSGDISTGSVTVTFSAGGTATVTLVTLVGSTVNAIRGFYGLRVGSGSASVAITTTGSTGFPPTDLLLGFIANQGVDSVGAISGMTTLQSSLNNGQSGVVGYLTPSKTRQYSATFAPTPNGYYIGFVGIQ